MTEVEANMEITRKACCKKLQHYKNCVRPDWCQDIADSKKTTEDQQ